MNTTIAAAFTSGDLNAILGTNLPMWLLLLGGALLCPPILSFIYILCSKLLQALGLSRRKLPLPPGSMGWPYIGETFQLYYSKNPNNFFAQKERRYGPVFKTHILGYPSVMMSSPEAAKFVLVTKANLFKPTYPASKMRMMGRQAIFFQEGDYHIRVRRLVLRSVGPDAIREKVANVEAIALQALRSWNGRQINTFQEMKAYSFNVAMQNIFGKDELRDVEELKRHYLTLEKGYNSMPINLPGTLFFKAMRARRHILQMVAKIVESRRQRRENASDLLGSFMEGETALTDEQITDNVIGVIFAARDTTASLLTWVLKNLADNPKILQAVTEEQEEIMRSKSGNGEESLTWADTKKMPITTRVIQESLRLASILNFTFREAVEDVEYEGYLIPKGWKVMPLFRNIHHSSVLFPEPERFDPSRFEVSPKPNTFLPFGNGIHSCPGNELAKLEALVLLHHLTTKYRWSLLESEIGIQFAPFALPMNGLPIRVSLKTA